MKKPRRAEEKEGVLRSGVLRALGGWRERAKRFVVRLSFTQSDNKKTKHHLAWEPVNRSRGRRRELGLPVGLPVTALAATA